MPLAVTVTVPVAPYGDALLAQLASAITPILPYAAGITVLAIAVGMLKRWLGHRRTDWLADPDKPSVTRFRNRYGEGYVDASNKIHITRVRGERRR